MMSDDIRQLFESVRINDWQNCLRLCRKNSSMVHEINQKKQKPLYIAFKHESYESAGVLMRFGAKHLSCPENLDKVKAYMEDLVKHNLYTSEYDLEKLTDSEEDRGILALQLRQMSAIFDHLDPEFDRSVLEQIQNVKNLDVHGIM